MMVFIRIQGVSPLPCLQNKFRTLTKSPERAKVVTLSKIPSTLIWRSCLVLYEVKSTLVCNYSVLPTTSPDLTRRPWGSEASLSSLENVVSFVPRHSSARLSWTTQTERDMPCLDNYS